MDERIRQAGEMLARNFETLGLPVEFVDGVSHTLGDTLYFNLKDISQFNVNWIKQLVLKQAVATHLDMQFELTKTSHFKVEVKYPKSNILPLASILDTHSINIGRDTDNELVSIDFNNNTPHLLIAGTTGSGKSVLLKTLFCSIYNTYYNTNRSRFNGAIFYVIDPKGTEFNEFRNKCRYIDTTFGAIQTLHEIEELMDYRYKNNDMKGADVFVFIDELADLMLTSRFEVEEIIVRIAQKGRACGIHLIVATQRPSVDVVSGLIKANLPTRLILRTASMRDSIVCIDHKGAEALVGNGDCIFKNGYIEKHFKVAYPDQNIINSIVR